MNLIRYIKKLVAGKLVNISFSPYSASPDLKSDVYFMDGVIGINSDSSVIVGKSDADTYAMIVSKAQDVITKNGLKDGDVFVGRNKNFILFRNGNQTIKSTIINIHANELQFVGNKINFNGVELYAEGGKLKLKVGAELKEIAVVGGEISTSHKTIITSGQ